jgi:hypothetical protein
MNVSLVLLRMHGCILGLRGGITGVRDFQGSGLHEKAGGTTAEGGPSGSAGPGAGTRSGAFGTE